MTRPSLDLDFLAGPAGPASGYQPADAADIAWPPKLADAGSVAAPPGATPLPQFLSTSELADLLGICKATVLRRIHSGDIRAHKQRGQYHVTVGEYRRYCDATLLPLEITSKTAARNRDRGNTS